MGTKRHSRPTQTSPYRLPIATVIRCDNQGAMALAKNPQHHSRTKHIDISTCGCREAQTSGRVNFQYVTTKKQVADIFTKALPRGTFEQHHQALGLLEPPHATTPSEGR